MKKNFLLKLLTVILVLSSIVCFAIGCGEPPHAHVYDQTIVDKEYLESPADCNNAALYYYSCTCGAKGNETFEYGEALGHSYTNYKYNNDAKCEVDGTETATCDHGCGEDDTRTKENSAIGHVYGEWISNNNGTHTQTCANDNKHKITKDCNGGTATCTEKAICKDCGVMYGGTLNHTYDQTIVDEKYLESPAECNNAALYYYSCTCGAKGNETFEYGNKLSHDFINGECSCGTKESVGLEYTLSDDESYYILKGVGNCADTDMVIPNTYNEKPVKSIGDWAFADCINITSLIIGDEITEIGDRAFTRCDNLIEVRISNSVKNIGGDAFSFCPNLSRVEMGNSVINIGSQAFALCTSLTSIIIPDTVINIEQTAFVGCTSLTDITVEQDNGYYKSIDGNLYSKDGKTLIQYASNKKNTVFTIPDGVQNLGYAAFYACSSLESVVISNSVESIGDVSFFGCSSLINIFVHEDNANYKSIDGNLYSKDGKTLILYATGKTNTSFTIPDGVQSMGYYTFAGCNSLESVVISDSVESIGHYAFYECISLTNIIMGNCITSIGFASFTGCSSLESVLIPNTVQSIGQAAFYGCGSLTSITFSGTTAEWNAISKGLGWEEGIKATFVQCSDGVVYF